MDLLSIGVLLLVLILLIPLSWIWPPNSPWAPWWRTNKKIARAMCRLAKVSKKDTIYDLGSGTGTALLVAAREFEAKGVGIEIDPLRFLISSILLHSNKLSHKIKIVRKNFFDVNISDATVIFVYLVPKALERLRSKLLKELKPGTLLVSFRYKVNLPLLKYDKKNDIYLYKISST